MTDACIHLWFGNFRTVLYVAIDDATGQVVTAFFDKQETLNGYYNIYYQIFMKYGIPYLFKTDKRTVLYSTPEFNPRIERLFESFQLRLIPELKTCYHYYY